MDALHRRAREVHLHAWSIARVGEERLHGEESGGGEDAVVELHEGRVGGHVAPEEVVVRCGFFGVEGVEEFLFGGREAQAHVRKLIVD